MTEGRVIEEHKSTYIVSDGESEFTATLRGAFYDTKEFPKVGDVVVFQEGEDSKAVIEEIKPRVSTIARKVSDNGPLQIIVTNVDIMFIVMGLDGDFNVHRLQRYISLAAESNIRPVIVLNKKDVVDNLSEYLELVHMVAEEIPIHAVSAISGEGMDTLLEYFKAEETVVLLGSSGAGKSTMTNWLVQSDKQKTQEVRGKDSKGRHTTTSRQLFKLPNGGYIIDTPGMRELGLAQDEN